MNSPTGSGAPNLRLRGVGGPAYPCAVCSGQRTSRNRSGPKCSRPPADLAPASRGVDRVGKPGDPGWAGLNYGTKEIDVTYSQRLMGYLQQTGRKQEPTPRQRRRLAHKLHRASKRFAAGLAK